RRGGSPSKARAAGRRCNRRRVRATRRSPWWARTSPRARMPRAPCARRAPGPGGCSVIPPNRFPVRAAALPATRHRHGQATEAEAAPAEEAASPADGPAGAVAVRPAAPGEATAAAPARSGEEGDGETFVYGDDDDDLPAAQVASAGATADPVKDYLKQIGKVPLLNAEQEVELAKRIEAGLFAEEKLAGGRRSLSTDARIDLEWIAEDGTREI